MSILAKLIIGGWTITLAMVSCCALAESGELLKIRERINSWLKPSPIGDLAKNTLQSDGKQAV